MTRVYQQRKIIKMDGKHMNPLGLIDPPPFFVMVKSTIQSSSQPAALFSDKGSNARGRSSQQAILFAVILWKRMMLRYDTDERIVFPYGTGENSRGICMLVDAGNGQRYNIPC
jgi:hypothetical protein